jgi:hypothetical protein
MQFQQRTKKITFNDYFSMEFTHTKKKAIKKNLSCQSFQFFLRSSNLDQIIFKYSLVHNGMMMLMIVIFLG